MKVFIYVYKTYVSTCIYMSIYVYMSVCVTSTSEPLIWGPEHDRVLGALLYIIERLASSWASTNKMPVAYTWL